MSRLQLSLRAQRGLGLTPNEGVGAAHYGSGPAPAGYHWEFVTSNGAIVTSDGVPVVALVEN